MYRGTQLTVIFLAILSISGCATSRSIIDVPYPAADKFSPANDKEVFIASVKDQRVFETAPREPNIPSLDPTESQNDSIRLRSIGRKRNTFGKALGDIILKEDKTVETLMAASIRQAFIENGYRLIDSKDKINDKTTVVDATINKFWSWMNPGFSSITLSTEIATDLSLKSAEGVTKTSISIKNAGNYQTGMEGNWLEVLNKALQIYIDDLKTKIN